MAASSSIGTLTILSGQSVSNVLNLTASGSRLATMLGITAPAALTGIVTVYVAQSLGGIFVPLQSPPGTDVNIAAAKAVSLIAIPFGAVQLVSSGTEGADRAFPYVALGTV